MATFKPKPMGQEDRLRVALARFHASRKNAENFEALLLAGAQAYRQGIGISPDAVHRIVVESMEGAGVGSPNRLLTGSVPEEG